MQSGAVVLHGPEHFELSVFFFEGNEVLFLRLEILEDGVFLAVDFDVAGIVALDDAGLVVNG